MIEPQSSAGSSYLRNNGFGSLSSNTVQGGQGEAKVDSGGSGVEQSGQYESAGGLDEVGVSHGPNGRTYGGQSHIVSPS